MKKIILVSGLFLGVLTFAQTKEAKVKELIKMTEADRMLDKGVQQFMAYYNDKYKDLPSNFWDEFLKEVNSDKIANLYVPIYNKYYTESDIDELIKFYKTPVGKKTIANMPSLMQEAMDIGTKFAEELNKRVQEKINKNYNFQSPPPPKN